MISCNFPDLGCNSTQILTNATSSLSQIIGTSMDSVTNISVQGLPTTTLNALTTAINNRMTSSQQITIKRKRVVERPYGESLTTVEALLKVNEKEKKKRQKTTRKPQSTSIKKRLVPFFLPCCILRPPLMQNLLIYYINFS